MNTEGRFLLNRLFDLTCRHNTLSKENSKFLHLCKTFFVTLRCHYKLK